MRNEKEDRETIVSHAIGIASEEKRAAYLDEACGNDTELKRQVERRIEQHFHDEDDGQSDRAANKGKSDSERSPRRNGAKHDEDGDQRITRMGPYKILKQIGESPVAIIYQAEQQEPVQLRVAIKVIKHGPDWRQIVARFEAEKHVLSLLDHPNIARFLGAGARQSGQPYFVTELVEGLPLTTYCDKHKQSLQQRLGMFVTVCQAVQYAHQKGVIHGDLKPSNVLVSGQDDKPAPKVLGFGVAKAVRRKLTDEEPSTGAEILGDKPEYLSPEQADPDAPDIDTRSDVYSLGVLLYELVTGTTPLTQERLKDVSMTETLGLIRDEDPPAPSTRLHESTERKDSEAAKMQMKPKDLVKAVSGDLDSVIKKALQKDRNNRYATVSELARDIQRYLDKEPVEASPPSTRSQLRTLRRKYHRVTMLVAMIALVSFLIAATSAGLTVWAWIDEHHAKKAEAKSSEEQEKAQKAEKEAKGKLKQAEEAYKEVRKERDQARDGEKQAWEKEQETKAILAFLKSKLLGAGRPGDVSLEAAFWAGSKGQDVTTRKDVTLRRAVDETEAQVTAAFMDRPLAEAAVREMLGLAYLNVGEAEKAVKEYERAFALRSAVLGDQNPETADARNRLAIAYRLAGKTVEASRLFHHNPNSPSHADALTNRGSTLLIEKKPAEAEMRLREGLTIRRKNQPDDWTTFKTESLLGEALLDQNKFAEAEPRLLSGWQGLKDRVSKMPSDQKGPLTRALQRLIRLYESWGKPDKAAKWRKELETVQATNKS